MPNTNPTAAPVDYPPAVIEEASAACDSAYREAINAGHVMQAGQKAAEAYADVLARHTVAVRTAAEPDGAYLAAAMTAAIGTGRGAHGADCGCCACLAPLIDAAPITPEQAEIARLTAERNRALGQLETARMQASAVMTGAEAQTATIERMIAERLTLTAERDALAKRVEALRAAHESIRDATGRAEHQPRDAARFALVVDDDKAAQS